MLRTSAFVLATLFVAPVPRVLAFVEGETKVASVLTPHRVAEIKNVSTATISPDGKRVAYTLSVPRKVMQDDDGANFTELWILAFDGGEPRAYVAGKSDVSAVQWMPDSKSVAFVQKRGDDKAGALYVLPIDGGEARRALASPTGIASYSIAPDGERVAFTSTDADPEARKKAQEKGFKAEVYEEDVKPVKLRVARLFDEDEKPRVLAVEGSLHQVRWSPVDDRLLIATSPTPLVDDEYMAQSVTIVDVESGKELARFEHEGKLGAIQWSPDGKRVALQGAADLHDPNDARLFVGDASGGKLVELTARQAFDVDAFAWQDATHLMAIVSEGVQSTVQKIASDGGEWKVLAGREGSRLGIGGPVLTSLSLSRDGQRAAFVGSTPAHPAEAFTMSHGDKAPKRRTTSNAWLDGMALAKQEPFAWKARDGLELEGVLVRPLDEVAGKRYPLIVYVHGGPEAHEQNGWQTAYAKPGQVAAARGFAVFHPNYRGSTGRGLEFSKLSQGDPAGKEFDDVVDGVDALIASGLVDAKKVGVTGGSYGGYATAWCSTRYSDRFAAGVMFVGISDKLSKLGTTDIPNEEYLVHARKHVWDDWAFFLDRSPIKHADQSKTPLLILHGKDDPRVNPGQSRELYRHLKLRGKAPVRLVLYPGEGHGNRKCANKLDYSLRMLEWFGHYLTGPGGAPPPYDVEHDEAPEN